MNKFIFFILSMLLGIIYESLIIVAYAKFLPDILPDEFYLLFLPLIIFILTSRYFIIKKKGYFSVIGLFLGFVICFILFLLGLGLGGA